MTGGVACSTGEDLLGCESRLLSLRGSVSALSLYCARDTARGILLRASLIRNSNGEHHAYAVDRLCPQAAAVLLSSTDTGTSAPLPGQRLPVVIGQ